VRWLWIFCGGGLGALARVALASAISARAPSAFPWGTFAVNALGCLAIGAVAGVVHTRSALGSQAQTFLTAGLLGGFTTFSAFGFETFSLIAGGARGTALAYALGSVALGVVGVGVGHWLARGGH
jgi:CrcB protein